MSEYRACILRAADYWTPEWIATGLPPEHRITGQKADPGHHTVDYIVEGPSLPLVASGDVPGYREIQFTAHWHEPVDEFSVTAQWVDLQDGWRLVEDLVWTVGRWSTMDAYRDWRREMNPDRGYE